VDEELEEDTEDESEDHLSERIAERGIQSMAKRNTRNEPRRQAEMVCL